MYQRTCQHVFSLTQILANLETSSEIKTWVYFYQFAYPFGERGTKHGELNKVMIITLICLFTTVNPTSPTPIRAYNDYCLQPKAAGCSPPDDTTVLWQRQQGTACEKDYKQFRLNADGVLYHHCSGKRVCPKNGATGNGVKIVISSKCSEDNSKFVRTKGWLKCFKGVGRCLLNSNKLYYSVNLLAIKAGHSGLTNQGHGPQHGLL